MTSSEPVDVLRWFDDDAASWGHVMNLSPGATVSDPDGVAMARLSEARAAVAELAEAVREERKAEAHAEARHEYTDAHEAQMAHWAARERTDAALARVQGE